MLNYIKFMMSKLIINKLQNVDSPLVDVIMIVKQNGNKVALLGIEENTACYI